MKGGRKPEVYPRGRWEQGKGHPGQGARTLIPTLQELAKQPRVYCMSMDWGGNWGGNLEKSTGRMCVQALCTQDGGKNQPHHYIQVCKMYNYINL